MTTKLYKTKIKCAVFDLDGTLLNTIKTINHYLNYALSAYGMPPVSEADTMAFVGNGAVKLIERAINSVGGDMSLFDSVYTTYNEAYNADPYYLTEPYGGVQQLLSALKEQGVSLAVLSNKPDFAVKAAVGHFFPNTFDLVYGGRENIPLKPSPDALYGIMQELSVTKYETAYIGDSEPDVYTAKNAAITSAFFVTYGFRTKEQLITAGAEILFDYPLDILDHI